MTEIPQRRGEPERASWSPAPPPVRPKGLRIRNRNPRRRKSDATKGCGNTSDSGLQSHPLQSILMFFSTFQSGKYFYDPSSSFLANLQRNIRFLGQSRNSQTRLKTTRRLNLLNLLLKFKQIQVESTGVAPNHLEQLEPSKSFWSLLSDLTELNQHQLFTGKQSSAPTSQSLVL